MARDQSLGGRLARGAKLTRLGVLGATGIAGAAARDRLGVGDSSQVHQEVAERVAEVLGEMKGAAMKVGQILSFVDLDLPPELRTAFHDALATLRDDAPPFDPEAIREVVRQEFGAPADAVFASWDDEPIAAASIGQVHAAKLDDGREVVVKVQYPGVAEAVRADLRNAETLTPLARLISPNQDIGPLLEELRERVDDELDYERESRYQRGFAKRYAGHPFIHVPDVVADMCRRRVLVADRVYGQRFDDFVSSASEHERQRAAEIIFRFVYGSLHRYRLFNGDPHPGNYLVEADGRIAFLDYGSVKMFSRERYRQIQAIDRAVAHNDRDGLFAGLRDAGFIPPNVSVDEDLLWDYYEIVARPMMPSSQPFSFTSEYAAEVLRPATDPMSRHAGMLRQLNLPGDYLLLNRIQVGLNSVMAMLGATNDWRAIRDEYVADGDATTPLGVEDQRWDRESAQMND